MAELIELCNQLDTVVLDYFDTLDEIYLRQSQLEATMRDGLFLMSKARYSLGATRVSILQIPEEDLGDANYRVHTKSSTNGASDFQLSSSSTLDASKQTKPIVRKRVTGRQDCDKLSDSSPEEWEDDPINLHGVDKPEAAETSKPPTDPLNWFGVLVPQALRQSQDRFRRVLSQACLLSSLQSKLLSIKQQYKQLHAKKMTLLNNEPDAPCSKAALPVEEILASHSAES